MIRRLIKKVGRSLLGRKPEPPTPQKRYEPPAPPNWMEQDNHDHGHSHDHGHEHSHNHGQQTPEEPEKKQSNATQSTKNKAASNIDVEAWDTPNPNAYKFTVSKKVTEKSFSASSIKEAKGNPLATALLSHDSVASVFGVNDFVTVTKTQDAEWSKLIPEITQLVKDNV
jgi:hypothetical protein